MLCLNINNIGQVLAYSRKYGINKSLEQDVLQKENKKYHINSYKNESEISKVQRDYIDITKSSREIFEPRGIGFAIDKGTAANTTITLDNATFEQICSYLSNNPDQTCRWSEMGVDGDKKWVVINGQRFEYRFTEEEKEAFRKMAENSNLVNILTRLDKEKAKLKAKSDKKQTPVNLNLNSKGNLEFDNMSKVQGNEKLQNLSKNEPVMKILKHITQINGGSITLNI